ncbi:MAG: hypothetical protein B0W54_04660 [Cellvibrio sp. 79]|nr:MAG: hypothetical protein B0W54_04660 [Cellvibrio sp. 79]
MSYKEEIKELTELVRSDDDWSDIRNILNEVGFMSGEIVMAGFAENEDEREFGIFINKADLKVYEYERSTADGENNSKNIYLYEKTGDRVFYAQQPHIELALEMISKNEI